MEPARELVARARDALYRGDLRAAQELSETALQTAAENADPAGVGASLDVLGDILQRSGSVDDARRTYASALSVFAQLGNATGLGDVELSLGALADRTGDAAAAAHHFERALQAYTVAERERGMGRAHLGLAGLAAERGAPEDARRHYEQARRRCESADDSHGVANVRYGLASMLLPRDPRAAADEAEAIIQLYEQHQDRLGAGNALLLLARAKSALGALADAERHARSAGTMFESVQSNYGLSQCCEVRGELALRDRDLQSALVFFTAGQAKAHSSGRPHYEAWMSFRSGTVLTDLGRWTEGLARVEQARSDLLQREQKDAVAEIDAWMTGARALLAEGTAQLATLAPSFRLVLELIVLAAPEDRYVHLLAPIWPVLVISLGIQGETRACTALLEELIEKGVVGVEAVTVEGRPLQVVRIATPLAHAVKFELPAEREGQILRVFERVWRARFLVEMIEPRAETVLEGLRLGVYLMRQQRFDASTDVLRAVIAVARTLRCPEERIWMEFERAAAFAKRADLIQWSRATQDNKGEPLPVPREFARLSKACGLFLALVSCAAPDDRLSFVVEGIWLALCQGMVGADPPLAIEPIWSELQATGLLRFTTTDHDKDKPGGAIAVRRYELDPAAEILPSFLPPPVRDRVLLALARAWADYFKRTAGSPTTMTIHAGFGVAVYLAQMGKFGDAFAWVEGQVRPLAQARGEGRWVLLHLQRIAAQSGDTALQDRLARLRT